MQILKCSIFLLTFAGFIFMGCSDKYQDPVTPNTSDEKIVTSLQKTTGPGAWIIQYSNTPDYAYGFIDENNGYLLILGIKDPTEFCAGTQNYDVFNFKELWLPNADPDQRRVILKMTGVNTSVFLWQFDTAPNQIIPFICNYQPMAEGTVKYVNIDNDLYAPTQDNKNVNSLGTRANGTLTGTDGQIYKLNLVYHSLWDGEDISTVKVSVTIHLAQTGKK